MKYFKVIVFLFILSTQVVWAGFSDVLKNGKAAVVCGDVRAFVIFSKGELEKNDEEF